MLNYLKRCTKNDVILSYYSCKLLSFFPDPTLMNVVLLIPERKKTFYDMIKDFLSPVSSDASDHLSASKESLLSPASPASNGGIYSVSLFSLLTQTYCQNVFNLNFWKRTKISTTIWNVVSPILHSSPLDYKMSKRL